MHLSKSIRDLWKGNSETYSPRFRKVVDKIVEDAEAKDA